MSQHKPLPIAAGLADGATTIGGYFVSNYTHRKSNLLAFACNDRHRYADGAPRGGEVSWER